MTHGYGSDSSGFASGSPVGLTLSLSPACLATIDLTGSDAISDIEKVALASLAYSIDRSEKMSREQQGYYRAGEAKGQAQFRLHSTKQEKTGQMADTVRDKAHETKDKASEMAGNARDRTQESKDQTGSYLSDKTAAAKDKTWETTQAAKDKAAGATQATKEKASEMAESGKETAQAGKENTGSVLQKTGEQVKSMAQGAADAVKQTFGMADEPEDQNKATKKDNY
ncbi:hypothetical protein RJ640_021225 [Escallonia rubra]|uniref:Uncharacterized protein n=1 Tax=Escallonia rubra TaxID=112253 RepID=A0AA88U7N3_9ASTE|nr:hypothetical protein RJ640_021225 [Escallonia rubra]